MGGTWGGEGVSVLNDFIGHAFSHTEVESAARWKQGFQSHCVLILQWVFLRWLLGSE